MTDQPNLLEAAQARLSPWSLKVSAESLKGPWMRFPVVTYTWTLTDEHGRAIENSPKFVIGNKRQPSPKSSKFRDFQNFIRQCLQMRIYHEKQL